VRLDGLVEGCFKHGDVVSVYSDDSSRSQLSVRPVEVLNLLAGMQLRAHLDDASWVGQELFNDPAELVAIGRSSISLMRMRAFCQCPQGLGSSRQRHVLRAGFFLPLRGDDPWQQLVDAVARMVSDALKDVAQVALRVDPVELG
jgi:hypothetical protein